MDIQIDFLNKMSLSAQIENAILEEVTSGRLVQGAQLPTVRELASQLRVNFNTVARAYRSLDAQGWINTRQGRGTFISRKAELKLPIEAIEPDEVALTRLVQNIIHEAVLANISLTSLTAALLQECQSQTIIQHKRRKRQTRRYLRKPQKRSLAFQPGNKIRAKKNNYVLRSRQQ
jgi:GntR family transcriptional regulator